MTTVPTHQPGDRVRIQHDPKLDFGYTHEGRKERARIDGSEAILTSKGGGSRWYAVSETLGAWFEPSELRPIVTDPDGLEVEAPAVQPSRGAIAKAQRLQEALDDLASTVEEARALRAACEAVTGTVGLPAPELAARVLAGVQRLEASAADYVNSRARDLGTSSG